MKKINVNNIEMVYKPTRDSYYEEPNCNIFLRVDISKKLGLIVERRAMNVEYETASKINELMKNPARALVESKSKNLSVAKFANIKMELIPQTNPRSNWKKYEQYVSTFSKLKLIKKELNSMYRYIDKQSEFKDNYKPYNEVCDDILNNIEGLKEKLIEMKKADWEDSSEPESEDAWEDVPEPELKDVYYSELNDEAELRRAKEFFGKLEE